MYSTIRYAVALCVVEVSHFSPYGYLEAPLLMGIWKQSCLVILTAIAVTVLPNFFQKRLPIHIGGSVEEKFRKVEEIFRSVMRGANLGIMW